MRQKARVTFYESTVWVLFPKKKQNETNKAEWNQHKAAPHVLVGCVGGEGAAYTVWKCLLTVLLGNMHSLSARILSYQLLLAWTWTHWFHFYFPFFPKTGRFLPTSWLSHNFINSVLFLPCTSAFNALRLPLHEWPVLFSEFLDNYTPTAPLPEGSPWFHSHSMSSPVCAIKIFGPSPPYTHHLNQLDALWREFHQDTNSLQDRINYHLFL